MKVFATRSAVMLVAAILCAGAPGSAQAPPPPERITLGFSDPNRVGQVEIDAHGGSITIRGTNRKDVLITARERADSGARGQRTPEPLPPGFRRLPRTSGFDVEESDNQIEISTSHGGGGHDFDIEVPARTNLEVSLVFGGDVTIRDVEGDIEVNNAGGTVTLTNVAGAVVADAVMGAIKAVITRAAPDKPMAFSTLTGDIDVTFPAAIRATFKLRSDGGDVITNFDLQMKPSNTPQSQSRQGKEPVRIEVNRSLIGTVNGGGPEIELRSVGGRIYLRQGK
jgi:DUF4097 and DUF4098 domain-containing protein YvlB